MKIIVISNCAIIREGIVSIVSKQEGASVHYIGETIKEAVLMIKGNMADVLLLGLNDDGGEELEAIKEIGVSKTKVVIIDFYGSKEFFIKALKIGVQGYIMGKSNEEEIMYAINQILNDKKYYDSYFVDRIVNRKNDNPNKFEDLTIREREILVEIAKGLSNKKISEKFVISEHTVKKHISHIFGKLNINDRTEAALYVNKHRLTELVFK